MVGSQGIVRNNNAPVHDCSRYHAPIVTVMHHTGAYITTANAEVLRCLYSCRITEATNIVAIARDGFGRCIARLTAVKHLRYW
jgi:hypothetical protein